MTARHLAFLAALRHSGVTQARIACDIGMDELAKWRKDPEFKAAMEAAKEARVVPVRAKVRSVAKLPVWGREAGGKRR